MNEKETEWQKTRHLEPEPPTAPNVVVDPTGKSALIEYIRLLLILVATSLLVWFAATIHHDNNYLSLIATILSLVALITSIGPHGVRVTLLTIILVNVISLVVNRSDFVDYKLEPVIDIPNFILSLVLFTAIAIEVSIWISRSSRNSIFKVAAWSLLAIPALVYIAGIPITLSVWETYQEEETHLALKNPEWNIWKEMTFRSSKFAVFALFTYGGACAGSFLNVVANSVPKGISIGLRDSKCPQCDAKINRFDNLPIFSYINLGAQCRNCSVVIPPRYLIVELIVAGIFGSLFLYQLVTGCANIPSMNISHKGILWIVFYPKWPAIGIYFFHALFMCGVLVLGLIEWDRLRLRPWFASLFFVFFVGVPLVYWPMQPVSALDHLPITLSLSPLLDQVFRILVGGIAGAIIGLVFWSIGGSYRSECFYFALVMAGIVVGWQALFQITILFGLLSFAIRIHRDTRGNFASIPTSILLFVIMMHHPLWKAISDWWI